MVNFKKVLSSKFISIIIVAIFFLNSSGYTLHAHTQLRTPISFSKYNSGNFQDRFYRIEDAAQRESSSTSQQDSNKVMYASPFPGDFMTLGSKEKDKGDEENKEDDAHASKNEDKKHLNEFIARYGILPESHQLSIYINSLAKRLFPDVSIDKMPRFKILASTGAGINGWTYADRTIVLTPELIGFAESEEELVFVILHEIVHLDRKHFQTMEDIKERSSICQTFGFMRYREYEADIVAFYIMSDKGFNGLGGISFMNRLSSVSNEWDIAHGSSKDRSLNLQQITYLTDLNALSHELTPVPEEVHLAYKGLPNSRNIEECIINKEGRFLDHERIEAIKDANWQLLQLTAEKLYTEIEVLRLLFVDANKKKAIIGRDSINIIKDDLESKEQILQALLSRFEELYQANFADAYRGRDPLIKYFILNAILGIPLFTEINKHQQDRRYKMYNIGGYATGFFDYLQKKGSLGALHEVLDSNILRQSHLVFPSSSLNSFICDMINFLKNEGSFDNEDGDFDFKRYLQEARPLIKTAMAFADSMTIGRFYEFELTRSVIGIGLKEFVDRGLAEDDDKILDFFMEIRDFLKNSNYLLGNLIRQTGDIDFSLKAEKIVKKHGLLLPEIHSKSDNELANDLIKYEKKLISIAVADLPRGFSRYDSFSTTPDIFKEKKYENLKKECQAMLDPKSTEDIIKAFVILKNMASDFSLDDNVLRKLKYLIREYFMNNTDRIAEIVDIVRFWQIFPEYDTDFADELLLNWRDNLEHFSLSDLEKIVEQVNNTEITEERFNSPISASIRASKIEDSNVFRLILLTALRERVSDISDASSFFIEIERFLQRWRLFSMEEAMDMPNLYIDALSVFAAIFNKGISFIDFSKKDPITLHQAFLMSYFMTDNINMKNLTQGYLLMECLKGLSCQKGLGFIFDILKKNEPMGIGKAIEYLIEEKAETSVDFEKIKEKIPELFSPESNRHMESWGGFVALDALLKNIYRDRSTFLKALLKTGQDETEFKEYVFDPWYDVYKDRVSIVDAIGKSEDELKVWERDFPKRVLVMDDTHGLDYIYISCELVMRYFYLMDPAQRYLLLRDCLLGKGGILKTESERAKFFEDFLREILVNGSEDRVHYIIKEVFLTIVETASDEILYFIINPLLMERIANMPDRPASWNKISSKKVSKDFHKRLKPVLIQELWDEFERHKDRYYRAMVRRLSSFARGGLVVKEGKAESKLFSIVPKDEYVLHSAQLKPMEFIVEMAKNLGAPGVRFLQLLGQFIAIPEDYRKTFMQIYDSMKGQSRLSAYEVVKREDPEYSSQIAKWGPRIGGGSEFTVYKVTLKDGSVEALKVLNPNVRYHTKNTMEVMEGALIKLSAGDDSYKKVKPLLENLEEWIEADTNDVNYFTDDTKFLRQNNGFCPEGFNYRIYVPKSFPSRSNKILREEYIEGRNFTQDNALSPAERKERVSLLVKNYFSQIRGKTIVGIPVSGNVLVLSDIHKGNFRQTIDGRIGLLDRLNYLKFSLKERLLFQRLFNEDNVKDKIGRFIDYLLDLEENLDFKKKLEVNRESSQFKESLIVNITANAFNEDIESIAMDALVAIRGEGIVIPLRISLLIKNLNALNRMAKEVGFNSLIEANEYLPRLASNTAMTRPVLQGNNSLRNSL